MSKYYTSTYILRADPGYDQLELRKSILEAVNTLTTGEKRIYRDVNESSQKSKILIPQPIIRSLSPQLTIFKIENHAISTVLFISYFKIYIHNN